MRRRQFGLTMMDVMFLVMIITIVIVPMFGLFPMGRVTLRKAHLIETAIFIARRELNLMRVSFPDLLDHTTGDCLVAVDGSPYSHTITVVEDNTNYKVTIDLYLKQTRASDTLRKPSGLPVDLPIMVDAVVTVVDPSGQHPTTLSSRISRDVTEMSKL